MSLAPEKVVSQNINYPSPDATHDEVVSEPELFFNTLKTLHASLGTRFMVPVIGRKELNLHVLYVEVTKRGGYDKVVLEKKWREISSIFNFTSTTTSASFVLKKHYLNLLYHYEQVYFFNSQGPVSATPLGSFHLGSDVGGSDKLDDVDYTSTSAQDSPDEDASPLSMRVIGTIDGKLDCGYLVSVNLGTEQLYGVMYHPNEPPAPSEDLSKSIVPYNPIPGRFSSRRRKRKRKRWGGDPNHPKPNRSGYNFFFAEKHSVLRSLYPESREREFTKMIGEAWNNLSSDERMVYQNMGLRDKERYKRELKEYHEKIAANQTHRHDDLYSGLYCKN